MLSQVLYNCIMMFLWDWPELEGGCCNLPSQCDQIPLRIWSCLLCDAAATLSPSAAWRVELAPRRASKPPYLLSAVQKSLFWHTSPNRCAWKSWHCRKSAAEGFPAAVAACSAGAWGRCDCSPLAPCPGRTPGAPQAPGHWGGALAAGSWSLQLLGLKVVLKVRFRLSIRQPKALF